MKHTKLLAYAVDYSTQDLNDIAMKATDKRKAMKPEHLQGLVCICPEPLIGGYALDIAWAYADREGVMIRDFLERLVFQYQHRQIQDAKELE